VNMPVFLHERFNFMTQALKDEYMTRCGTVLANVIAELHAESDAMEASILTQYSPEELAWDFLTTEERKGACYYEMLSVLRANASAIE